MSDDILFSSLQVKNFTLKNRIGVAPMTQMNLYPKVAKVKLQR